MNYMLQGLLVYSRLGSTHKGKTTLLDMDKIIASIVANLNSTIKKIRLKFFTVICTPLRGIRCKLSSCSSTSFLMP